MLVNLLLVDRLEDGRQIDADDHQHLSRTVILNELRGSEGIAVPVSLIENAARNAVQVVVDDVGPPDSHDCCGGADFIVSSPLRSQGVDTFLHDAADFPPQKTDRLPALVVFDHVFGYLDAGVLCKSEDVSVDEGQFAL